MRVFLTGATGYLGSHLSRRLVSAGHEVHALVRSPSKLADAAPGIHPVPGDLLDPETYRERLSAVDAVLHAAALVRVWVRPRELMDRTNVDATLTLIREAAAAGVPKILYTSSFIALGPTPRGEVRDESARPHPPYYNDYHRTKSIALEKVRALKETGTPVVILFPGVIYGPGPLTAGNHVVQVIRDFARGRVPGYIGDGRQRWNFAWIHDVVDGHLAALERAAPGSEYFLGGENRSMREFMALIADLLGKRPPRIPLPRAFLKTAAALQFAGERLFGREPTISPGVIDIYIRDWAFRSDRSVNELDYRITPFAEGIGQTIAWMRDHGVLKR